jgi:peroxin-19
VFDAALMEGMESLLRQLAGNAGIMPDLPPGGGGSAAAGASGAGNVKGKGKEGGGMPGMTAEEEEAAWQKALESVLSGEGLRAMGLDDPATPAIPGASSSTAAASAAAPTSTTAPASAAPKPSFDDTIRRTLDSLKSGGSAPAGGAGGAGGANAAAGLEEFLRQMGHDPAALDALNGLEGLEGLDGLEGDDDIGGILDGMMSQLMNKEILEEPMAELEAKVSLPYTVHTLEKYTDGQTACPTKGGGSAILEGTRS